MSKWISVEDRLPEVPKGKCWIRVIAYSPDREPQERVWNGKYFTTHDYYTMKYCGIPAVTHWQTLPKPPKKGKV